MEHLNHDVLIIGGGAAGLRAAIAAAELNPKLNIQGERLSGGSGRSGVLCERGAEGVSAA